MGYPDPKQAILEQLTLPRAEPIWQNRPNAGRWQTASFQGGGHDADPNGVRFIKKRGIPGQELHAITFADRNGRSYRFLVGVVQNADGNWEVTGQAGGAGNDPPRDRPWVNFCGWGWPNAFCGGGWIVGTGSEAATRVRLRFKKGPVLEDTIDDGVTLLIADASVDVPATAEILDVRGAVLARHTAF